MIRTTILILIDVIKAAIGLCAESILSKNRRIQLLDAVPTRTRRLIQKMAINGILNRHLIHTSHGPQVSQGRLVILYVIPSQLS